VTGRPIRPSIEARLSTAGLPPLPRTAWLELDLDALTANLATLRVLAGAGVPIRPVVKADAYGHGAVPIAAALEAAGADGLCVATIDEALELRQAGIALPILVLYPVPGTWLDVARENAIDVTASDAVLLERLLAAPNAAPTLGVQLEVETGLGRGGFPIEDVASAAARLVERASVRLTGLWTHLQAPEDRALTERQMGRFEAAIEAIAAAGVELPARHVAASGSLLGEAVAAYDGARPGLSIYGIVPDPLAGDNGASKAARAELQPVMSLNARPVRVLDLPAGWGISYGPSFTTERPSRIATLPIGYGDGWARSLSNRAEALVRGRRVPVVGTVAMDAIMADVTDVPGPPVGVDDLFTLIGAQGDQRIGAYDLARTRTTISWEIVTAMSRRLPRVYHSAAGPLSVRFLAQRSG
jgi:alanine racemase